MTRFRAIRRRARTGARQSRVVMMRANRRFVRDDALARRSREPCRARAALNRGDLRFIEYDGRVDTSRRTSTGRARVPERPDTTVSFLLYLTDAPKMRAGRRISSVTSPRRVGGFFGASDARAVVVSGTTSRTWGGACR